MKIIFKDFQNNTLEIEYKPLQVKQYNRFSIKTNVRQLNGAPFTDGVTCYSFTSSEFPKIVCSTSILIEGKPYQKIGISVGGMGYIDLGTYIGKEAQDNTDPDTGSCAEDVILALNDFMYYYFQNKKADWDNEVEDFAEEDFDRDKNTLGYLTNK